MPKNWADVDLVGVDLVLLERVEFGPRVGHAVLDRLAHLGGQLVGVEVAVGADADGREPVAHLLLVGQHRGEPHCEVEDLEELRRGLLLVRRQRRHEVDRVVRAAGGGWFRNTDNGCT